MVVSFLCNEVHNFDGLRERIAIRNGRELRNDTIDYTILNGFHLRVRALRLSFISFRCVHVANDRAFFVGYLWFVYVFRASVRRYLFLVRRGGIRARVLHVRRGVPTNDLLLLIRHFILRDDLPITNGVLDEGVGALQDGRFHAIAAFSAVAMGETMTRHEVERIIIYPIFRLNHVNNVFLYLRLFVILLSTFRGILGALNLRRRKETRNCCGWSSFRVVSVVSSFNSSIRGRSRW